MLPHFRQEHGHILKRAYDSVSWGKRRLNYTKDGPLAQYLLIAQIFILTFLLAVIPDVCQNFWWLLILNLPVLFFIHRFIFIHTLFYCLLHLIYWFLLRWFLHLPYIFIFLLFTRTTFMLSVYKLSVMRLNYLPEVSVLKLHWLVTFSLKSGAELNATVRMTGQRFYHWG